MNTNTTAIKNIIDNLEAGSFKVIITDDGQARDVTKENIENLNRVLETAYEKDAYIAELNAALQAVTTQLEWYNNNGRIKANTTERERIENNIRWAKKAIT